MTEPSYDVHGSGPVLLVLPGGAGHPMGLDALVRRLAARHTVVVLDPLGLAHGRLGRPVPEQRVADWSEAARRALDATLPEGESAHVLGFSSGGIAALDLLARHPRRLRHVVAHEPPCVAVLPDGDQRHRGLRAVHDTYRSAGLAAAGARLAAELEGLPAPDPAPGEPPSPQEELSNPMAVFLSRVLVPFSGYVPPAGLPAGRLTLAAGTASRGQLPHRTAAFLAERHGCRFTELPGGHLGAAEFPEAFADGVSEALAVP
ncbi:alpha/beta hydrolase [Streptomyces sp. Ru71]|uniref:alpha/beta fold hydrolase n=1 Tax=Streptomyces sp. Ru71 TaxID=2080746 RepID=UPI000CDD41F2|nr:alpha/beta hydrolase [Streptomyces sp. Ru71]POX44351.1 alpha/beta hydrolase [Streptomyces sp. Ru71]